MIRRPLGSIDPNSIRETELHTESRRRHNRGERESLHRPRLHRERDAARQRAAATRRRETDEAGQNGPCVIACVSAALRTWCGGEMSISNAMLLRFASGVPYGFRDRQPSDQSCFCTNTRTTRTRQNKPYRLGAVRAGVVGARGRCWTAAAVPVAVVLPCGVCCCIAENKQNTIINRKT